MGEISREAIIEAPRAIASRMGVDTLRREDFFKESRFTQDQLNRLFPDDGWRGVLEGADLRVTFQNIPTPDEALLADFHRVVREMGRIPTGIQYDSRGEFSFAVFKKRFGGIRGTLTRYHSWLKQNVPDAPELELVQIKSRHEIVTQPSPVRISAGSQQWAKGAGVVFGAPISFRGLRHAQRMSKGWFICSAWLVPRLV